MLIKPEAEPSKKKEGNPSTSMELLLEKSSGLGQPRLERDSVSVLTVLLMIYFFINLDCVRSGLARLITPVQCI